MSEKHKVSIDFYVNEEELDFITNLSKERKTDLQETYEYLMKQGIECEKEDLYYAKLVEEGYYDDRCNNSIEINSLTDITKN